MKNICFNENLGRILSTHPLKIDVNTSIASTFLPIINAATFFSCVKKFCLLPFFATHFSSGVMQTLIQIISNFFSQKKDAQQIDLNK